MLATDENNPDFVGARNPDDLLRVRFYEDAFPNAYQTQLNGRAIFDNVIMIEIMTPGSALNIINRAATTLDKIKWPKQWAFFEANSMTGEMAQQGTPLGQWPILNKAQCEMLRALKFHDVEQIAGASDEQLSHIGMAGGMAALSLREKAQAYLNVAKNSAYVSQAQEELKKREAEIAELKAKDALRDQQFAAMQEQLSKLAKPNEPVRRKRRTKAEMEQARA